MGTAYNDTEGSVVTSGVRSTRPQVSSAEMSILDGATLTTAELNVLAGINAGLTAAQLSILFGVTAVAAELNYLDLTTLGTGEASKAVVLDDNSDYTYPAAATIVFPSGATVAFSAGASINIAGTFQIGGTTVTSTAAKLNLLSALNASASEMAELDASARDVFAEGVHLTRSVAATYDFAVDGGTIGEINLASTVPANCIVWGGLVDVWKTCTTENSDAGTGAIHVEGANDLVTAVSVVAGSQWDVGLRPIIPVFTAATAVKTTTARQIKFTLAGETWTAGQFNVILFYTPTTVNT